MKKLFFAFAFLTGLIAHAQVFQKYNQYGGEWKGHAATRVSMYPTGCGDPPALNSTDAGMKLAATYFDSCNHRYWQYDPKLAAWDSVHLGVAGSGAAVDTTNKWVNTLYRRSDSVFYNRGGNEVFAFKDSTGGSSSTLYYTPEMYGAAGDGVTDDGPEFNTMIADVPEGATIYITGGKDYFINTQIVVNKKLKFLGAGSSSNYLESVDVFDEANSRIFTTSETLVMIKVTESLVTFNGISFENRAVGTPTDGCAIQFGDASNDLYAFWLLNCSFAGFYDNVRSEYVSNFGIDNMNNSSPIRYGLLIDNINHHDAGDSYITNSNFYGGGRDTAHAMIYHKNGGGMKMSNIKFNNNQESPQVPHKYSLRITSFQTVDYQISNCSFENYLLGAIKVDSMGVNTPSQFTITGCQFAGWMGWPNVIADIAITRFDQLSIVGNTFKTGNNTQYAITLDTCTNVVLMNEYRGYTANFQPNLFTACVNIRSYDDFNVNTTALGLPYVQWSYGRGIYDVANTALLHGQSLDIAMLSNTYFNSSWKRKTADQVARISASGGDVMLLTGVTGAANSAISWLNGFKMTNVAGAVQLGIGGNISESANDLSGADILINPTDINATDLNITTTGNGSMKRIDLLDANDNQDNITITKSGSKLFRAGNYPALGSQYANWLGNTAPSGTNYFITGTGAANTINTTGTLDFRVNSNVRMTLDNTSFVSTVDISVPDEAYGVGWNGSLEVPTKNALYDKIETISGGGSPGGASGDVQTNNGSGGFAGSSSLHYDGTALRVGSSTSIPAQTNLYVRGTGSSASNTWRGRVVAGGDNVAFLMGEVNSQAWLGAHSAALDAWADFRLNPDGPAVLYLGNRNSLGQGNPIMTLNNSTETVASSVDITVPDEAYGAGWNGSLEVPTKNSLYDKIESLPTDEVLVVDQTASPVNNTGTSETTLQTILASAAILTADEQSLYGQFSGTFNDATATGQLKLKIINNSTTTTIFDSGTLTVSGTGAWVIKFEYYRTGSTTAKAVVTAFAPTAGATAVTTITSLTGLDHSLSTEIRSTGQAGGGGGGSNDITGELVKIFWATNTVH